VISGASVSKIPRGVTRKRLVSCSFTKAKKSGSGGQKFQIKLIRTQPPLGGWRIVVKLARPKSKERRAEGANRTQAPGQDKLWGGAMHVR